MSRDGEYEEHRTEVIIRWMNTLRIPLYLCVVLIQYTLFTECVEAGGLCDVGIVLVPLGLALLDVSMVVMSNKGKTGLRVYAFILSSLSLGIAVNSLQPYFLIFFTGLFRPLTVDEVLMMILGVVVALVSLVELVAVLQDSQKERPEPPSLYSAIRTYEN